MIKNTAKLLVDSRALLNEQRGLAKMIREYKTTIKDLNRESKYLIEYMVDNGIVEDILLKSDKAYIYLQVKNTYDRFIYNPIEVIKCKDIEEKDRVKSRWDNGNRDRLMDIISEYFIKLGEDKKIYQIERVMTKKGYYND
jgi:hypothetical protein